LSFTAAEDDGVVLVTEVTLKHFEENRHCVNHIAPVISPLPAYQHLVFTSCMPFLSLSQQSRSTDDNRTTGV